MERVTTIGLDIAKSTFQVHGVDAGGEVILRRRLTRARVVPFFEKLTPCLVKIEACATSHHWARELRKLGHEVRLMPPSYVKAYVKRQKNDTADAEATCEAVTRPTMRFVEVKSPEQQSVMVLHGTRSMLMRQRIQLSNVIRGHMAERQRDSTSPLVRGSAECGSASRQGTVRSPPEYLATMGAIAPRPDGRSESTSDCGAAHRLKRGRPNGSRKAPPASASGASGPDCCDRPRTSREAWSWPSVGTGGSWRRGVRKVTHRAHRETVPPCYIHRRFTRRRAAPGAHLHHQPLLRRCSGNAAGSDRAISPRRSACGCSGKARP